MSTHEDVAVEGLVSLLDELIDDKRVSDILRDAIKKLQGRKCKPHWWRTPKAGDDSLVCDACGRELEFVALSGDIRSSILNGYENRHGSNTQKTKDFQKAFYSVASSGHRPAMPHVKPTGEGPRFPSRSERMVMMAKATPVVREPISVVIEATPVVREPISVVIDPATIVHEGGVRSFTIKKK